MQQEVRLKTVHTPEAPGLKKITIPTVWISDFTKHDPTSATVKFRSRPSPTQLKDLVGKMGWAPPSLKDSEKRCDGKFKGGHFILSASLDEETVAKLKVKSPDGAVDTSAQVDIEYGTIGGFQLLRMEIQGKNKKGFRWELRFNASTEAIDAAANLESYMARTDNSRGSLCINYLEEPEQGSLVPDGVEASEEQKQAALEM